MEKKKLITSILVILAIGGSCFAGTEVPVTATATVAPEGQYAPVITATDQTMREGEVLSFEVLAADSNTADTVTIEISQGQPPWLTIETNTDGNPARMTLRASPPTGTTGNYRVYFTATDDSPYALSSTKDIYITVNPLNQPPVITGQNQTVQIGQLLNFTVNCQDPDGGDTVTLTYTGKPNWLAVSVPSPVVGNPIDIIFSGTPQALDEGTYVIRFTAVDNGTPQQTTIKEITIIVSSTNNPPVLDIIRNKEVPVRITLEFPISATDADGDVLTYSASGSPFSNGATFNPATRKFSWTPGDNQVGAYPAHFEVSDGDLTDSEDIIVYVSPSDAPIFDPLPQYGRFYIKVGKTLRFAVTARDPNDDPITYAASDLPQDSTFDPLTHTFTWTPQSGQEGEHNVQFMAFDGRYTTTMTVIIYVNPTSAPELGAVSDKYIRVGQTLMFSLSATDPDGDPLAYSVSNNPSGSVLTGADFTWTPDAGQAGTYQNVMFSVTDGTYFDYKTCWIFVLPNGAPIIEHIGDKYVVEGRTVTFTVSATDPDADPLTYLQPQNAPKGSYFDPSSRVFTWTPVTGEAGVYNDVIFNVTDGINIAEERIWIFVAANDAPVVEVIPPQYVKAGHLLSFGVSAYDPNGDALTYKALNLPQGANFADRTFTWIPTLAQAGTYKDVLFEVTDGVNIVSVRTWIFVEAPQAPVFESVGDKYVIAGQTLNFVVNATDPDGDPLIYSASNLPSGASFNPSTRTFTWAPGSTQVGIYPDVLFNVTDGIYTVTERIWIFVKAAGAPTINVPAAQYIKAGTTLELGITATDPDTPAGDLTYSASNLPPGATFINQVFTWTPTTEQIGTYPNIAFAVSDGTYSDSGLMWIFVTSPSGPEFTQDVPDKYGRIGEPIIFSVSATDPDDSPGALSYYGINLPPGATFTDQTFRWTPAAGQAGVYKDVRLEVRDPDNNIAADIFWVFIAQNSAPELDFIGTRYGTVGQPLIFTISAQDLDGDTLTYSASNLPGGATFDGVNRRFSWTPTQAGTYTDVHFEVTDGALNDTEDISIVVSP